MLLPSLLGPFIGFLLLISFGPWAYRRLTSLVKNQVDEATKHSVEVHYQQLSQHDPEGHEVVEKPAFQPLSFQGFEYLTKSTRVQSAPGCGDA